MHFRALIQSCAVVALVAIPLATTPARAGLFGDSDEEIAARQHETNQDAIIKDLTQRVHDLEDSLSRLTGQNEALSHRVQVLNDKIDRQKKDFNYRLCTMAGQQLGATQEEGGDQSALPCPGFGGGQQAPATNAPPPQSPPPSDSGTIHLSPPPGVLGTLPAKDGGPPPPRLGAGSSSNRSQFDAALNLLAKARYDDARSSFRSFADANPQDELAPQAIYWVGDIAYVQKDYPGAAHAFAEQIKKYPSSSRSPDSMLKLGQSLLALGQTKEGCLTLGALPSRYTSASKSVLLKAASTRKDSCR